MTVTVESEPLLDSNGGGGGGNDGVRESVPTELFGGWRTQQWAGEGGISYGALVDNLYPHLPPRQAAPPSPDVSPDPRPRITYTWTSLNVYGAPGARAKSFGRGWLTRQPPPPKKHILKNVSGVARPGEVLAVMGASGAGKTTLLDALTLRSSPALQVTGTRALSGAVITRPSHLFGVAAYVPQKDLFIGWLTVREHLIFQARLRMGRQTSEEAQMRRVREVMDELGLRHREDTVIGVPGKLKGLSGGEMKRLSFAAEVLTEPTILLCDEPTSGQDSFMARATVDVLAGLAHRGKTVILTIHQPSSEVYSLFDRVLFMAEGRVAFHGSPHEAAQFFAKNGAPCPPKYNPADFFVQLMAVVPNEEEICRRRIHMVCDAYESSEVAAEVAALIDLRPKGWSSRLSVVCASDDVRTLAPTWMTQFRALLWRSWLSIRHNSALVRVRFAQTLLVAILLSVMYYGQKLNQNGITNLNGALFTTVSTISFQNVLAVIKVFCGEQEVFRKEYLSGLYRLDTYFLAKTIAEIPLFTALPILYGTVVYFMIGLYPSFSHFMMTILILVLISHCATSFGYMISSMCNSIGTALAIGTPAVIPILLFGGFFANLDTIPKVFSWVQWISWFRYGNEALLVNQWSDINAISCHGAYKNSTCIRTGHVALQMYSFKEANLMYDLLGMVALIAGLRVIAMLSLYFKLRKHH